MLHGSARDVHLARAQVGVRGAAYGPQPLHAGHGPVVVGVGGVESLLGRRSERVEAMRPRQGRLAEPRARRALRVRHVFPRGLDTEPGQRSKKVGQRLLLHRFLRRLVVSQRRRPRGDGGCEFVHVVRAVLPRNLRRVRRGRARE